MRNKTRFSYLLLAAVILSFLCSFFSKEKYTEVGKSYEIQEHLIGKEANLIQVAVIGGGVSALAAAQVVAKKNIHTVVFSGEKAGGYVPNNDYSYSWLGLVELKAEAIIEGTKKQVELAGGILSDEEVVRVDFAKWPYELTLSSGVKVRALSVIIATGTVPGKLNVPGEKEYAQKGVFTDFNEKDALWHDDLWKNKGWKEQSICVVGYTQNALAAIRHFAPLVKKVSVIVDAPQKTAGPFLEKIEQELANIEVHYQASVEKMYGKETLQSVRVRLSDGKTRDFACTVAVVAIGKRPNSHLFSRYVSCDQDGYIRLRGRTQSTYLGGVFAAGDVTEDYEDRAVVASADSVKAGYDTIHFLQQYALDIPAPSWKEKLYTQASR